MSDERLSPLGGEADPNTWHFAADHGPLPNPMGHTCPLLTHDEEGRWSLIGTAFYIGDSGLFVTAKHNVEHVLASDKKTQISPVAIFHLYGSFGPEGYCVRPIGECWLGDKADVALGIAATATNKHTGVVLTNFTWPLSWSPPPIGATVATYAFPVHSIEETDDRQGIHFRPEVYAGPVLDLGLYHDSVKVSFPFVEVDFRIHGAASGGPIVGPDRCVVAVNSAELVPVGPAWGAQIRCLQDAFLERCILAGESEPRRVGFAELVSRGVVTAHDFAPGTVPSDPGYTVRLDTVPIASPGPRLLSVDVYS